MVATVGARGLLTPAMVAGALGLSRERVRQLVDAGLLTSVRVQRGQQRQQRQRRIPAEAVAVGDRHIIGPVIGG